MWDLNNEDNFENVMCHTKNVPTKLDKLFLLLLASLFFQDDAVMLSHHT